MKNKINKDLLLNDIKDAIMNETEKEIIKFRKKLKDISNDENL